MISRYVSSSAIALVASTAAIGPAVTADADVFDDVEVVGQWDWSGDNPLVNQMNPGTNDAVLESGATATGGTATVADGSYINLGVIDALSGATKVVWTFNDISFADDSNHVLAGSVESGWGANSLFYIRATPSATAPQVAFYTWEQGNTESGSTSGNGRAIFNQNPPANPEIAPGDLVPDETYDMQFIFNGGDAPANERFGLRIRAGDSDTWGDVVWQPANVDLTQLQTNYTQPVLVGKYIDTSSANGAFTVGTITVAAIPEPGSASLFGLGLLLISRRRR